MKNVVLLGSTGSIGTSTAKVAGDLPEDIRLVGLAAGGNGERGYVRPAWPGGAGQSSPPPGGLPTVGMVRLDDHSAHENTSGCWASELLLLRLLRQH